MTNHTKKTKKIRYKNNIDKIIQHNRSNQATITAVSWHIHTTCNISIQNHWPNAICCNNSVSSYLPATQPKAKCKVSGNSVWSNIDNRPNANTTCFVHIRISLPQLLTAGLSVQCVIPQHTVPNRHSIHPNSEVLILNNVHSASMKTERMYFLFWSKNGVSHLCMDSAIFCPKHVGTIHNWRDLQIYSQFLLLQCLDHQVKKQKSQASLSGMTTPLQCIVWLSDSHRR